MEPFLGEIRLFGGTFAPQGWLACDGSLQPIATYDALFALIGTTYGGDGQSTFAMPDLRGRVPVHRGPVNQIGTQGGVETVTLVANNFPVHTHTINAATDAFDASAPVGNYLAAAATSQEPYRTGNPVVSMNAGTIGVSKPAGGGMPHDNMQPFTAVMFIIATEGIYPSQP